MLILGVSYLQDVGDTRYTPIELVFKKLLANKVNVTLHDPYVSFWQEYEVKTETTEEILSKKYDAVIMGTPHTKYFSDGLLEQVLSGHNDIFVFDPHGSIPSAIREKFPKNSFKIIGRGDV